MFDHDSSLLRAAESSGCGAEPNAPVPCIPKLRIEIEIDGDEVEAMEYDDGIDLDSFPAPKDDHLRNLIKNAVAKNEFDVTDSTVESASRA